MTQVNASQNFAPMRQIAGLEGFQFNDKAVKALTNNGGSFAGRALTAIAGFFHLINTEKKITEQNNEIVKGFFDSVSEQYGRDAAMSTSMQLLNANQGRLISVDDIMNINRSLNQRADSLKDNPLVKKYLPEGHDFQQMAQKFPIADNMAYTRNLLRQLVHLGRDQLTPDAIATRADYAARQTMRESNNIHKDGVDIVRAQLEIAHGGESVQANVIHSKVGDMVIGQKIATGSMEKYGEDMPQMQVNPALRNHGDSFELHIAGKDAVKAYQLLLPIISADQSPIGKWTLSNGVHDGSKLVLYPATENPESNGHKMELAKFIVQAQNILANAGISRAEGEGTPVGTGYFGMKITGMEENDVTASKQNQDLVKNMYNYEKIGNLQGFLKQVNEKSNSDVFSPSARAGNNWVDYNNKIMLGGNEPAAEEAIGQVYKEMQAPNTLERATMIRDINGGAKITLSDGQKTSIIQIHNNKLSVETSQNDETGRPNSKISLYEVGTSKEKIMEVMQYIGQEYGISPDSMYNLAKTNHQGSVAFGIDFAIKSGIDNLSSYQPHLDHSLALTFNVRRNPNGQANEVEAIATSIMEYKMINMIPTEKLPVGYMDTENKANIDNSKLGNFGIVSMLSNISFKADEHGEITPNSQISMNGAMVDINARLNRLDFERVI